MKSLLIAALLLIHGSAMSAPTSIQRRELEQVLMVLQYVAGQYPAAVRAGRVTDATEYRELTSFTAAARTRAAAAGAEADLAATLASLDRAVRGRAATKDIQALVENAVGRIADGYGVRLRLEPPSPPDPAEGERVWRENCAVCHGVSGNGRGPAAAKLNPPPANFSDASLMALESPASLFNVASIGVAGTVMPAWHGILSGRELWNAVLHLWRFQTTDAVRERGRTVWRVRRATITLPDAAGFLRCTDAELGATMPKDLGDADRAALVAWLRSEPALVLGDSAADRGRAREDALVACRAALERARDRYAAGDTAGARDAAVSAYLDGFERIEKDLGAVAPDLVRDAESGFGRLRESMQAERPAEAVAADVAAIESLLDRAGRVAEAGLSGAAAFGQSFVIILREGFEIMLVLAAIATYLIRVGQRERTVLLYAGAGAAVVVSLGTAWIAGRIIAVSPASQEVLEGATMLVAAVVLFWMSHWILSLTVADKWNRYIQGKARVAVQTGSHWSLAGVGFLVVFREGVETVLFYQGLSYGAPGHAQAIWVGFGVGALALLFLSLAMYQLGLRMPMRPFFIATSALLYVMVFSFTGKGIRELQAGGMLVEHLIRWLPSFPVLGVFPSIEGLIPQALLLVLGIGGVRKFWPAKGAMAPQPGVVQAVSPHEQILAIHALATRLHERIESLSTDRNVSPASHAIVEESRNLIRQLEAAARDIDPERRT